MHLIFQVLLYVLIKNDLQGKQEHWKIRQNDRLAATKYTSSLCLYWEVLFVTTVIINDENNRTVSETFHILH